MKNLYILFFLSVLILSCKTDSLIQKQPLQNYSEYCTKNDSITLSSILNKVKHKCINNTGVYVLEDAQEAMINRAWLCEYAEKSIDVQYFIFEIDRIGLIGIDYLVRAAERGIKVRVIVDDILLKSNADELLALNSLDNFSIKIYNPSINIGKKLPKKLWNIATDFRNVNQRMHNKTFIVDNNIAITGGRNVANQYYGYDENFNYRDRDVLLIGKETNSMQSSFNEYWNHPLCSDIKSISQDSILVKKVKNHIIDLHNYACNPENFSLESRNQINSTPYPFKNIIDNKNLYWTEKVDFIYDKPGKNNQKKGLKGSGETTKVLENLIRNAKKYINIQTPYLVTTDYGKDILKEAINKGVKVRILTNSLASTDNIEAFSGYKRDRNELLKIGVEIYEFKPDAKIQEKVLKSNLICILNEKPKVGLHSKSMVIDDELTVIGTFNFDPRSANLNTECFALIKSEKVASQVNFYIEEEFLEENSWKITDNYNPDKEVKRWKRVKLKTRRVIPKAVL